MEPTAPTAFRVVLIEDSPKLCAMLRDMLGELPGVEVVADAGDERGAIAKLEQFRADLAIVDLELREGSGLGVLRTLQAQPQRFGPTRAVVLSNHGHKAVRVRCAELGVERFFDKSFQMDELLDYIEDAVSGL